MVTRSGGGRLPRSSCAATLLVGVVALCFIIGKAFQRTEFISYVDPVSGYRCRFTFNSAWKTVDVGPPSVTRGPDYVFFGPSRNPIQQWIAVHLFHEQTTSGAPPGIYLTTVINGPSTALGRQEQIQSKRHFMIDGCPAVVLQCTEEPLGEPPGHTHFWVFVPHQSIHFEIDATIDSPDTDDVDKEMQAVIASFHVERTPVPSSGKQ